MSGIDFPPRDKKKVLKSFDGLDVALGIKREEESVDGSGDLKTQKNNRDKGRQARSRGTRAPKPSVESGAPTRLSSEDRASAAKMQAEMGSLENEPAISELAKTGPTLAEQAAMAKAGLKNLKPSTEADGSTLAEQATTVRRSASTESLQDEQLPNVETESVDATQNTPLPEDATLGEVRGRLRSFREKITGLEAPEGAQPLSASELYELRVGSFASKNGLTDTLEAVRGARSAYFDALVQYRTRGYAEDKEVGGLGDLKATYDRSLYWWKSTLEHKATELSGKEQAEALIIAKRDTILGPANLDVEARAAALNEKGKTAFGKAEIWLARSPQMLLKLVNLPFNLLGKGTATILHGKEEKLTQAEYANRYARASRILAGAGFATAVALAATPVAATTALLTFMVYGARGTIGTVAGVGAAKVAGGIFSRFFSTKKREALKEHLSKTSTSLEEYQEQQEAYKRDHTGKRQQEKMAWQMLAAMVAGSGTGLLTAPLAQSTLEHFGALKGVKEAADTVAEVNSNSPEAAASALKVSAAAKEAAEAGATSPTGTGSAADIAAPAETVSVAPPHPTTPEGLLVGATIHRTGEGFGEMIQEFKQNFREQLPGMDTPTPALAHVLNTNPNELTHELLVARDGTSLTMQPGDQFVADENQNIWFQPKGGEPQLVFENDPAAPGGFIEHEIHGHMQADVLHPVTPAPEVAGAVEPEAPAAVQEDPSAALNRAQAGGTVISASTGASEAVPFSSSTESLADDAAATGDTQAPSSEAPITPPAQPPAQAPEAAPAAPEQSVATPSTATEELPPEMRPFINGNEVLVEPAVTHLYSAPDEYAPGGRQLLVYGGGNAADQGFLSRVQQLTWEHPGEKIYFEAGEPTMYNGIPQKWITSAVYDPQSGFSMGVTPESPQMIGRINPQSFTSKLN